MMGLINRSRVDTYEAIISNITDGNDDDADDNDNDMIGDTTTIADAAVSARARSMGGLC